MYFNALLTAERLRELYSYDSSTGLFARKGKKRGIQKVGTADSSGYLTILIDGRRYKAHRLAWLYVYGVWPNQLVDHINMDPLDNRIENLREATASENKAHNAGYQKNSDLPKGVTVQNGKYRARIGRRHLGYFESASDAHLAYFTAAKDTYGEFATGDVT